VVHSEPSTDSTREVETRFFEFASEGEPFRLLGGGSLDRVTLAYETYGELSEARDNAILLFHALTGSQHAAGYNPRIEEVGDLWNEENHTGWWNLFVGPGLALDTDRFFVICANYLGGCYGSTGPTSVDPTSGRPYRASFPRVGLADTVNAQIRLLDHLGIQCLHAVIGNSTGGMASLSLATRYPDRVSRVIPAASGLVTTPLQLAHNFEQILAIENDPRYEGGNYAPGEGPVRGLALARMISHKSFVSLSFLAERSRPEVSQELPDGHWYSIEHSLESYMLHQGEKLPPRFDANAYLRILDAWQSFDVLRDAGVENYGKLFGPCSDQRYLVFTIDSDACFFPEEQAEMVRVLRSASIDCQHVTVRSEKGHDSFLLEPELFAPHLGRFLKEDSR